MTVFHIVFLMVGCRSHGGVWCGHWSVCSRSRHSVSWCYCWSLDQCKSLFCLVPHHASLFVYGSRAVRIDPLHLLAGCRNRRLNFALFCVIVYLCNGYMLSFVVLDLVSSVLANWLAGKNVKFRNQPTDGRTGPIVLPASLTRLVKC